MPVSKKIYLYLRILLFAIYIINGLLVIPRISVNSDEGDHFDYAIRLVKGNPEKIKPFDDASTMPVSALNVIPRVAEQLLQPDLTKNDWGNSDIIHGRYITLFVCLLTGIFIYAWSKEMYGERAGLFSLFLFAFCPNIIAQSKLFNTDAFAALFTVSTLYYYWKFLRTGLWIHIVLLGISLGAAQITKQSLTHLFIILLLFSFFVLLQRRTLFSHILKNLLRTMVTGLVVLLIINIGFLFSETGKNLGSYQFTSKFFNQVQSSFSFLSEVPLPLPSPFIKGLDLTKRMDEIGPGHIEVSGNAYLLGKSKKDTGFWYYYFVVIFFKTPVLFLLAIILLIASYIIQPLKRFFWENEFLLLTSKAWLLLFFSFFVNTQSGMRHILIVFPLLYILLGRIANIAWSKKYIRWYAGVFIVCSVATFYSYFPNFISYTNELLWNKTKVYKVMADSNIDFGQGGYWLNQYLKENPDVKIPSTMPDVGTFIIGVNEFLDLNDKHQCEWLTKNFTPVSHLRHCFLIFKISEAELKQKGLITL